MRRGAVGATALVLLALAPLVLLAAPPAGGAPSAPSDRLGTDVTPVGLPVLRHLADGRVTAYGYLANHAAVPTRITRDFAVAFLDAGGDELAQVTNGDGSAFAEQAVLAPGHTVVWHASSTTALPDAAAARVTVPAAIASDTLPDDAFTTTDVSVRSTGDGSEQVHAHITSADPRPQQAVTAHLVFLDAAGTLLGYDQARVGDGELAPGASTDLLVAHPLLPGEPAASQVVVIVDAQPAASAATRLAGDVPVRGRLVAGTVVTARPRLLRSDGSPLPDRRLTWRERRPGGTVTEVAHGVTGADGTARISVRLRAGTVVQVVYAGDRTTFGASTGDLVLGVRPVLVADVPDAASGALVVRGVLHPARPGARVELQRAVGGHWVGVASAVIGRDGRYRVRAVLPAGRQRVRTWVPAAGIVPATATRAVTVAVG